MKRPFRFALLLALATGIATPALAERDHDRDRHHRHEESRKHRGDRHGHRQDEQRHGKPRREVWRDCPPGLVQIGRDCVPRGQLRKHARRHHPRVGDVLRPSGYRRIADPGLYALEPREDWSYYRDDDQIYRVDRGTRRVLAVLELIQAFAN